MKPDWRKRFEALEKALTRSLVRPRPGHCTDCGIDSPHVVSLGAEDGVATICPDCIELAYRVQCEALAGLHVFSKYGRVTRYGGADRCGHCGLPEVLHK